jgi:hypothetical protein
VSAFLLARGNELVLNKKLADRYYLFFSPKFDSEVDFSGSCFSMAGKSFKK